MHPYSKIKQNLFNPSSTGWSPIRPHRSLISRSFDGSPTESPTGSPTGSPQHKKVALIQCSGTPENNFSSSTFFPFTGSRLFAETCDDMTTDMKHEPNESGLKTPFIPQRYNISLSSPISPDVSPRSPLTDFCKGLVETNFFIPDDSEPRPEKIVQNIESLAHGSFFTVESGFLNDVPVVQKTATVASMCVSNIDPTVFTKPMDKKFFLNYLLGLKTTIGNANFVQPTSIVFTQMSDSTGELVVVQPFCRPIPTTRFWVRQFLECLMEILQSHIPITDVKPENFGILNGRVVCLDPDIGKQKPGKVHKLVVSVEYDIEDINKFQKLLLVLMKLMGEQLVSKEEFRTLYIQKGVLIKYKLLDTDKSISETDINDFIMIINRLCPQAPQEHIDLLVKVLTVPFFE